MKKKLLLTLMSLSFALVGCGNKNSSSSESQQGSSSSEASSYEKITDVNSLFTTYESKYDYNFVVSYEYSTVYKRQYVETIKNDYQYMDGIVQLTYLNPNDSNYYTDYLYENPKENIYTYYVDMGAQKEYQTISGDNQYYAQYVATMDKLDIAGVDWAEDFLVNKETKTLTPKDDEVKTEVGKKIFGDNPGEYWEKIDVSYDKGYITKIDAVSIYMERVYYFTINLSYHTLVNIELPKATKEYVGSKPYYQDETYAGVALSNDQKTALQFLVNARDANYTVNTRWDLVDNGELVAGAYVETTSKYADGNAEYTYTNQSTKQTKTDYLISNKNGSYTLYVVDDYNIRQAYASGTNEYSQNITNFSLDQLNLSALDANDFIYNQEKGYIMPKNKETETKLVGKIFGFADNYYGLHIYLENNVISKVETSLYLVSGDSIASYKKIYSISNIGTTTIDYPSDIQL